MRFSIDLTGDERIKAMPGLLASLAPRLTKLAAQEWTEETLDYISDGRAFTSRSGQIEQGVGWASRGEASEVFANAEHSGWVERGTRAHQIRPKNRKALKIPIPGGGYAFRKVVNHPGSRPFPFMWADVGNRSARIQKTLLGYLSEQLS